MSPESLHRALSGIDSSVGRIEGMIERIEAYEAMVNLGVNYGEVNVRGLVEETLGAGPVAAGISAVTYLALGPGTFVFFGVIHLIAFATLVSYPLADRPAAAAALGAAVLAGGLALGSRRFPGPALAWLGLRPEGYHPADYLPVLPWYAWFLFGIAVAALLYPRGRRSFEPPRTFLDVPPIRALAWLGRRSLAIYLIHLPVLYGIVWGITRAGVAGR